MDAHLDLTKGNIKGESQEKGFENQINLLHWNWGMTNTGSMSHGGGGGAGKVDMQDFHFEMVTCTASPELQLNCATGQHISEALLTCRKAGQKGGQQKYLTIKFSELLISSFQIPGRVDAKTGLLVEQITFNFAKVEGEYFKQDEKGVTSSAGKWGYDLKKNAKV
ncbi:Uncharacterized protein ImpD [Fimbriiglobus ruber]|uniref:Uncharacterized protein ImpD n=1 Tax=Fimbriiglobus ruber TaxID=1908690 RepID=A0A225E9X9_9BACT|nr:Uncharacterized protein ImpD [Fimbriiglobus ruber]